MHKGIPEIMARVELICKNIAAGHFIRPFSVKRKNSPLDKAAAASRAAAACRRSRTFLYEVKNFQYRPDAQPPHGFNIK
jgi:hypothetical protein